MNNVLLSPPTAPSCLCIFFNRHEFPDSGEKRLNQTKTLNISNQMFVCQHPAFGQAISERFPALHQRNSDSKAVGMQRDSQRIISRAFSAEGGVVSYWVEGLRVV